jgi:hypothetical protein
MTVSFSGIQSLSAATHIEPCPPEKCEAIEEALRHFGVI